MSYLNESLIIKRLDLFQFYKNSKIFNFLNWLDCKFFELFLETKIKLKRWWKKSFIFNQLAKREQEIETFESSKILNYFLNNLKNLIKTGYFINKLFNK